jgi:hypothetical protein
MMRFRPTFGLLWIITLTAVGCIEWSHTPPNPVTPTGVADAGSGAECFADGDCATPGACEQLTGATCVEGSCVYSATRCQEPPPHTCNDANNTYKTFAAVGTCDPATGGCLYEAIDTPCPNCKSECAGLCDGILCPDLNGGCLTQGTCVPGSQRCTYQMAVENKTCAGGVCANTGTCVQCTSGAQCDDSNPCTSDTCQNNLCVNKADTGARCDDGNACSFDDLCQSDKSCRGSAINCTNDPGPCGAVRSCNGSNQCTVAYPTVACDDGNACTASDRCNGGGSCVGNGYSCTTSNSCLTVACDGSGGCTQTPHTGEKCNIGTCSRCSATGTCEPTCLSSDFKCCLGGANGDFCIEVKQSCAF